MSAAPQSAGRPWRASETAVTGANGTCKPLELKPTKSSGRRCLPCADAVFKALRRYEVIHAGEYVEHSVCVPDTTVKGNDGKISKIQQTCQCLAMRVTERVLGKSYHEALAWDFKLLSVPSYT